MLQECTLASCTSYWSIPHTTNHKNTLEVKTHPDIAHTVYQFGSDICTWHHSAQKY